MKHITVLGAGNMGSGIAAHLANCGVNVLLLDVATDDIDSSSSRSILAESARSRLVSSGFLFGEKELEMLKVGNLEDDLHLINDSDMVIEAITEDLQLKVNLYKKIAPYLNNRAIIASNTSTLPLKDLKADLSADLSDRLLITHFFNPPRYLQLLELVPNSAMSERALKDFIDFFDIKLGRTVITCKDTPGFIANRLGFFFMYCAICQAVDLELRVGEVDALLHHRLLGLPKTGVFALVDLIGLDVFFLIMDSLSRRLPEDDMLNVLYKKKHKFLSGMLSDGLMGNKSGAGFYRKYEVGSGFEKQELNLDTGLYMRSEFSKDFAIPSVTKLSTLLVDGSSKVQKFLVHVMSYTLYYASLLLDEVTVSGSVRDIDMVMRLGYNWIYGPFQILDLWGSGFRSHVPDLEKKFGASVPGFLRSGKKMYDQCMNSIASSGEYEVVDSAKKRTHLSIADYSAGHKPVVGGVAARLVDIGDGVSCFEICVKGNTITRSTFNTLYDAINVTRSHFNAMVIATDKNHFSFGADLKDLLNVARSARRSESLMEYGQSVLSMLKFADFPSVGAPCGYTLGGGFEIMLHCSHVRPYIETYAGLPESNLCLIPGWGGVKEMIVRCVENGGDINAALEQILSGDLTKSANGLVRFYALQSFENVTVNRSRLLCDAKEDALRILRSGYKKRQQSVIDLSNCQLRKPDGAKYDGDKDEIIDRLYYIAESCNGVTEERILAKEREVFLGLLRSSKAKYKIKQKLGII